MRNLTENIPDVKVGIAAVSRDCFPKSLSESRRVKIANAYREKYGEIYECPIIVENELDAKAALEDLKTNQVEALVVFLGNFGPETSETLLVKYFPGPSMMIAAAEEGKEKLLDDRGDASL